MSLLSLVLSDSYRNLKKLGQGTFAAVFAAEDENNQKVAIKQIYVQRALIDDAIEQVEKIKKLHNDHIIHYVSSFYDSSEFNLNLVMELCEDSLRGQMQDRTVYTKEMLQSFLIQMTSAFLELQIHSIMHLDLKPQNILISNKQGTFYKLCDFGCSQISNFSRMSGYQVTAFGTFNYLAPEMIFAYEGKRHRSSVDIWALGVTLYQMIYWRLPFSKDSNGTILRSQIMLYFQNSSKYTINYDAGPQAPKQIIDIIKMMIRPHPIDRITWKDLKQYLIKQLKVELHEFMNIKDLIRNFNQIFQLLLRALRIIKKGVKSNAGFWKIHKQTSQELQTYFTHYIYLLGLKFRQRQSYRWKLIPQVHKNKADKMIDEALKLQIQISERQETKQLQTSDFSYQQCITLDHLKHIREKIKKEVKLTSELMFLLELMIPLVKIIEESQSLFITDNQQPFATCFKTKLQ